MLAPGPNHRDAATVGLLRHLSMAGSLLRVTWPLLATSRKSAGRCASRCNLAEGVAVAPLAAALKERGRLNRGAGCHAAIWRNIGRALVAEVLAEATGAARARGVVRGAVATAARCTSGSAACGDNNQKVKLSQSKAAL
jgi:hypothetical protein